MTALHPERFTLNINNVDRVLTKIGSYYTGLCPFHEEQTPSFTMRLDKATYHCFGCGAEGTVK